jgi:hypothetical protein
VTISQIRRTDAGDRHVTTRNDNGRERIRKRCAWHTFQCRRREPCRIAILLATIEIAARPMFVSCDVPATAFPLCAQQIYSVVDNAATWFSSGSTI